MIDWRKPKIYIHKIKNTARWTLTCLVVYLSFYHVRTRTRLDTTKITRHEAVQSLWFFLVSLWMYYALCPRVWVKINNIFWSKVYHDNAPRDLVFVATKTDGLQSHEHRVIFMYCRGINCKSIKQFISALKHGKKTIDKLI